MHVRAAIASVALSAVLLVAGMSLGTRHARAQEMVPLGCLTMRFGLFDAFGLLLDGVDVMCNEASGQNLTPPFVKDTVVLCWLGEVWQGSGSQLRLRLDCYIPQSTDEVRAAAGWLFCVVLGTLPGYDRPLPLNLGRLREPGASVLRCASARRVADLMGW